MLMVPELFTLRVPVAFNTKALKGIKVPMDDALLSVRLLPFSKTVVGVAGFNTIAPVPLVVRETAAAADPILFFNVMLLSVLAVSETVFSVVKAPLT